MINDSVKTAMTDIKQAHWRPTLFIKLSVMLHVLVLISLIVAPDLWPWALAVLISTHLLISAVGLWPRSNWLGPNWTRLPTAAADRNEIALTIDDGPDPMVTPQVLDLLDRFHAKATFFCIGDRVQQHPELCREIVRRGHSIENHSQHHRHYFSLLGMGGFAREIQAAQETIFSITGIYPKFFRAPAGLRNPFLQPVLSHLGLRLTSWTVRGFDTQEKDAEKVKNKLLSRLSPGAILLLHDGNAALTKENIPIIVEVLPSLLDAANKANLHLVTLQEAAL
ncbi:polysaccharide deacetylase family protein [Methylotenera sp.]|uniref:polysaccharide deacetylase family protein n=1 Tax=Methylotenera sp. TaxID=2051956 RepID=UPI00272F158E|nr:polysaccharide deacetylase family protein [Methylotenera sp.]MDP2071625.1 polysaccharide deacetylase family protein [Methylotenera sp.]MDP3006715.1 polysaccharide deacetylase family protein [Methylotenera sp.]